MPRLIWCFPVLLFILSPGLLCAQHSVKIRTVVIDAGHGGHDPGALGTAAKEKNINLAIALKLGKLIRTSMEQVHVIFTRDKDNFVELYRRAGLANESKADLFISIHCNANKNHALKGAETYVMGLHKSQANLNIAKLENAAILLESDYKSAYDGFDPNSDESYIIFSLNQNANLDKSTDLASAIQKQMEARVGMNNRGVRQAGFLVLYKTTMPSVLVESGYLSNQDEEKFLMSEKGQDYIASAIYRAFKEIADPEINNVKTDLSEAKPSSSIPPEVRHDEPKHDTQAAGEEPVVKKSTSPDQMKPAAEKANVTEGLSYRVQIATEARELSTRAQKFSKFDGVRMYRHGGMYKYTVGDETDLASCLRLLTKVKEKGIKDAFVVIFRKEERIPQAEADRLMRK